MSKYKVPLYKNNGIFVYSVYDNWKQANKAAKNRGVQLYTIDKEVNTSEYRRVIKKKWFERIMKPYLHKLNKRKK